MNEQLLNAWRLTKPTLEKAISYLENKNLLDEEDPNKIAYVEYGYWRSMEIINMLYFLYEHSKKLKIPINEYSSRFNIFKENNGHLIKKFEEDFFNRKFTNYMKFYRP